MKRSSFEIVASLIALSIFIMPVAIAQVPQTQIPKTPYYGITYIEPPQLEKVFPPVPAPGKTPAFTKQGEAFTTQEELLAYISMLDEKSDCLTVRFIGTSQQGRVIPALYFTHEKDITPESFSKKPTVWLHAQIHGNEPAGGEAALVIAERLTGKLGAEVLNKINVIIIPRQNPDGAYAFNRTLASGYDGNRDHARLEWQENQVIHNEFKRYSPEVVIDAHEYGPYRVNTRLLRRNVTEYHDILLSPARNPNIPEELRDFAIEKFTDPTHQKLQDQGFSSTTYYTISQNSTGKISLTEGGPEARIGRNAFGLHISLSFLVESRGIGLGRQNFPRRVASHVLVHENLIRTAAKHATKLRKFIAKQRAEVAKKGLRFGDNDEIVVNNNATREDNVAFPFVDVSKGKVIELPVTYYGWTDPIPTLTRERPIAYFLRPEYKNIADILEIQGIQGFVLPVDLELPIEAYIVTNKTQGEIYDDVQLVELEVELVRKVITLPEGTYIYPTAQPTSGWLSLVFEPESVDSYARFGYIPSEVGKELAIYRFTENYRELYDEIYSRI